MTHKLAVGIGVLFCTFVAVLLLVLYYPKDSVEEDFDAFTRDHYANDVNSAEEEEDTSSRLKHAARVVEDMGALFLALVAVLCVVSGVACLMCACCCLKE